jgi:hypothetical protein
MVNCIGIRHELGLVIHANCTIAVSSQIKSVLHAIYSFTAWR